jgi:hypothetical protein
MDTNPKNCAKCGHTVNDTAVACAYCGADISSEGSPPQPDDQVPGTIASPGEPSSLPADDSLPVLDMADESASTPEGSQEHLDSETAGQMPSKEAPSEINETAAEGIPGAQDLSSDAQHQIDAPLPADEPIVNQDVDKAGGIPELGFGPDTDPTAIHNSELNPDTSVDPNTAVDSQPDTAEAAAGVIPLAAEVSAPYGSDDSPSLPDEPVLEFNGEDSSESEILGADILELVGDEPLEAESALQQPSEKAALSDEPTVETITEIIPDPAPDGPDNQDGQQAALSLPPDDDLPSATQSLPADVEEAMKTERSEKPEEFAAPTATAKFDDSPEPGEAEATAEGVQKQTEGQAAVGALKIEKAAKELAEAQKKQKANLAKAQARKKKKVELAKAQALKRKKAAALKAQALKKQKEAQALKEQKEAQALKEQKEAQALKEQKETQALKKQKEAQVGIEKAIQGMAAGSNSLKVDKPDMLNQGMESNAKILNLLKKYENQAIGINYDNSADIKEAELVEANNEFFSVFVKDKELNYSHPLKTILTIIEGQDGVGAGKPEQESKFNAVIKVYPLVLF